MVLGAEAAALKPRKCDPHPPALPLPLVCRRGPSHRGVVTTEANLT